MNSPKPQVAVYYFPNYHLDFRNKVLHGDGWTEWELVRRSEPRFEGHHQPNIPAWGETDESDPVQMSQKIAAAADHGIDTFIFDWYWYDDGPFLERGLNEGFLKASNSKRLKFALMWANHNWIDIHPAKASGNAYEDAKLLYPGSVSVDTFQTVMDYCIDRYFKKPNYWLRDGCPYFSIYELTKLIDGLGGIGNTKKQLQLFRRKVKKAGFKDLHLNAIIWNNPILRGETAPMDAKLLVDELGFDSINSYVWIHHYMTDEFPTVDYLEVRKAYFRYWEESEKKFKQPYYPNVTMGWDASPRTVQSDAFMNKGYPFMYALRNNTPQNFKESLKLVKSKLERSNTPNPFLTINAWNEWTEGSYLEPDVVNGMAYLEAIRDVFKQ